MFFVKIILYIFLITTTSCTISGTAFIGPAITGATTKSIGQASLSFGTNQIVRKIHVATKKTKKEVKKIAKKIENLNLEIKSKDFYASVKNLYLQDQLVKKEVFLFHR